MQQDWDSGSSYIIPFPDESFHNVSDNSFLPSPWPSTDHRSSLSGTDHTARFPIRQLILGVFKSGYFSSFLLLNIIKNFTSQTGCSIIVTACKRSLGKVIFSQAYVSHSVDRGSLYDVWLAGRMFLLWNLLSLVPCSFGGGGFCPGSLCQEDPPVRWRAGYASYWNAFLFDVYLPYSGSLLGR